MGGAGGASGSGAAGKAGAGGGSTACSGTSTIAKGDTNKTLSVGGMSRAYIVHVPSSYTGNSAVPLVLDFHPLGGSAAQERMSSGFNALSDQNGFIVAWPDGIDDAWNVGPCCTISRDVDDVGFAKAVVAEIKSTACIDAKRVYATGFSMGGGMSHYLACHAADIFAAVTPSAFDLLEENVGTCSPSRPISVLSFRGTSDTLVPYAGGASNPPNGCCPPVHFLGAAGTLDRWKTFGGCTGSPTTSGSTQTYSSCAQGVQVGLYTIQGGGHAQGPAGTAWDFLKTKSLP
jgi:polyhydroxybutyrate depolymerase